MGKHLRVPQGVGLGNAIICDEQPLLLRVHEREPVLQISQLLQRQVRCAQIGEQAGEIEVGALIVPVVVDDQVQGFAQLVELGVAHGAVALARHRLGNGLVVAGAEVVAGFRIKWQGNELCGQAHEVIPLEHELKEVVHLEMDAVATQRVGPHIAVAVVAVVDEGQGHFAVEAEPAVKIHAADIGQKALYVDDALQAQLGKKGFPVGIMRRAVIGKSVRVYQQGKRKVGAGHLVAGGLLRQRRGQHRCEQAQGQNQRT